jgi:gamma-glutamylcyclotransferase (GGCT)/AIG2-like uncharacterized protein YtfP
MKKLTASCVVSEQELMMIPVNRLEREIKHRLARDLAIKLIDEAIWSERNDYPTLTKEITAEVYLTDKETLDKYDALRKAFQIMKEEFTK